MFARLVALGSLAALLGCGSGPSQPTPDRGNQLPANLTVMREVTATRATAPLTCQLSSTELHGRWAVGLATLGNGLLQPVTGQATSTGWMFQTTAPADTSLRASKLSVVGVDWPTTPRCDLLYAPPTRSRSGRDLYLVHGLLSSAAVFQRLADTIKTAGVYDRIYLISYCDEEPILESGRWLVNLVKANSNPQNGCDFIGHSLGGLVIRSAVELLGLASYARNVITLGTPHTGADLAKLAAQIPLDDLRDGSALGAFVYYALNAGGYARVLQDLSPNSPFLQRLNWGPSLKRTAQYDYFAVGGNVTIRGVQLKSDLVVSTLNATWSGLGLCARSLTPGVVPCTHGGLTKDKTALDLILTIIRCQNPAVEPVPRPARRAGAL